MKGSYSRLGLAQRMPEEGGTSFLKPIQLLPLFVLHGALVGVLCFLAFSRYSGLLFNGLDGAYMLTDVAFQFAWTTPAAGFSANPLQGLADLWFNFNAWISPGFVLPYLFLDGISVAEPRFQASVYTAHALILFFSCLVAMRSLGLSWATAHIGAWATILLILPCFGAPLVYPILQLQPNLALTIAEALLIVCAISQIGRRDGRWASPRLRDAGAILALPVLAGHFLLTGPTTIMIGLPFFLFLTTGILLGAATRIEVAIKISAIAFVVFVLSLTGFAEFLLGMFYFTAAKFASMEFQNSRMSWYFVSILFQSKVHGPWGAILVVSGIAGLIHAALFAESRLAWVARAALAFVCVNMVFGAATVLYDFWSGPSPVYLEAPFWPVYAMFAARLIVSMAAACQNWLSHRARSGARATEAGLARLAALAALPVAIMLASFPLVASQADRDYVYPPSRPAIVQTLEERIGLMLGSPVRGRVATFQLREEARPVSWGDLHGADNERIQRTGNDFHLVGLWHYGIPTLTEYAPTLSPALFRATTRLLARPEDPQLRSVLVLRQKNASALAALGVRYVITDSPAPSPLRLLQSERVAGSGWLYLYEVPGAISGAASPVKFIPAQDFDLALEILSKDTFDPHDTVIVMEGDVDNASLSLLNGLSPAVDTRIRLATDGFVIESDSPGKSLLVIPVQFSHCLTFAPDQSSSPPATLFRVNALETGIVFSGRLSGKLSYFTGPFNGADCRIRDARDFSRAIAK